MIKKILASVLFLATPMLAQAVEGVNLANNLDDLNAKKPVNKCFSTKCCPGPQGPAGPAGQNGQNGKDGENGRNGENGKDGQDGQNGQNGRDGVNGRDGRDAECCCEEFIECNRDIFAYFYVIDPQTIAFDDSVVWDQHGIAPNGFTVNQDPGLAYQIIVDNGGYYQISYSVSALNATDEGSLLPLDYYTVALFLNDAPIAGSQYSVETQTVSIIFPSAIDVQQVNGQVLTFIPPHSFVDLRNVTFGPLGPLDRPSTIDIEPLQEFSVSASIFFQKLGNDRCN